MAVLAGLAALCGAAAQAGTAVADDGPGGSTSGGGAQQVDGTGDRITPGHTYTSAVGPTGGGPGRRYYTLVPGDDAGSTVSVTITATPHGTDTPDVSDGIEVVVRKHLKDPPCFDRTSKFGDDTTSPGITVVAGCQDPGSYTVEVIRNDTSTDVDTLNLTLAPDYGAPPPSTSASAPAPPGPGHTTTSGPPRATHSTTAAAASGGGRRAQTTVDWGLVAATAFGTGTVLLLVLVLWTVLGRRHARAAAGS